MYPLLVQDHTQGELTVAPTSALLVVELSVPNCQNLESVKVHSLGIEL